MDAGEVATAEEDCHHKQPPYHQDYVEVGAEADVLEFVVESSVLFQNVGLLKLVSVSLYHGGDLNRSKDAQGPEKDRENRAH